MISTKSTRKFEEIKLIEILPNILKTLILDLIQEVKQVSLREIRMLLYIMRLVKFSIETYPEFVIIMKKKLNEFINNPEIRIKKHTSNLAEIILFSIFITDYDKEKFSEAYFGESMDRNVLWIIKKIPEIEKENCPVSVEDRLKISFNLSKVGA